MYKVLQEIKTILIELLPWIPVITFIRLVVNFIRWKKRMQSTLWHEIGAGLFLLYLVAVSLMAVPFISFLAGLRLQSSVNLIPFNGIWVILQQGDIKYIVLNIIGNITMFIPIGFLIPLLWNKLRGFITVLAYGIGLSLLIETLQFFISRGTDIDDLILNTLGVLLGYIFYYIFSRLFPAFAVNFNIMSKEINSDSYKT